MIFAPVRIFIDRSPRDGWAESVHLDAEIETAPENDRRLIWARAVDALGRLSGCLGQRAEFDKMIRGLGPPC